MLPQKIRSRTVKNIAAYVYNMADSKSSRSSVSVFYKDKSTNNYWSLS